MRSCQQLSVRSPMLRSPTARRHDGSMGARDTGEPPHQPRSRHVQSCTPADQPAAHEARTTVQALGLTRARGAYSEGHDTCALDRFAGVGRLGRHPPTAHSPRKLLRAPGVNDPRRVAQTGAGGEELRVRAPPRPAFMAAPAASSVSISSRAAPLARAQPRRAARAAPRAAATVTAVSADAVGTATALGATRAENQDRFDVKLGTGAADGAITAQVRRGRARRGASTTTPRAPTLPVRAWMGLSLRQPGAQRRDRGSRPHNRVSATSHTRGIVRGRIPTRGRRRLQGAAKPRALPARGVLGRAGVRRFPPRAARSLARRGPVRGRTCDCCNGRVRRGAASRARRARRRRGAAHEAACRSLATSAGHASRARQRPRRFLGCLFLPVELNWAPWAFCNATCSRSKP